MKNKFNKTFKKKNKIKNKKYTIKDKTKYYSTDKNRLFLFLEINSIFITKTRLGSTRAKV